MLNNARSWGHPKDTTAARHKGGRQGGRFFRRRRAQCPIEVIATGLHQLPRSLEVSSLPSRLCLLWPRCPLRRRKDLTFTIPARKAPALMPGMDSAMT